MRHERPDPLHRRLWTRGHCTGCEHITDGWLLLLSLVLLVLVVAGIAWSVPS